MGTVQTQNTFSKMWGYNQCSTQQTELMTVVAKEMRVLLREKTIILQILLHTIREATSRHIQTLDNYHNNPLYCRHDLTILNFGNVHKVNHEQVFTLERCFRIQYMCTIE